MVGHAQHVGMSGSSALAAMGGPSGGHDSHVTSAQTVCPIMGGEINKDVYVDHAGYRVYFCCPGCEGAFNKDPDGHIRSMQEAGVEVDRTPEG